MRIQLIVCMMLIMSMIASPACAGCGRWVVRDNTDFLKDSIFDEAMESSTGSSATVNPDGSPRVNSSAEEKSEKTEDSNGVAKKKAPTIDLAGKWKVSLQNRSIDLILIQNGDRLQGYGTLLEKASDTPATATGSISDEGISLDVKLVQQKKDYRLDMALVKDKMQGSYELYEMETLEENGNATASRS
ncbi:MAG TPA: hypothetical protein PKL29_08075 [Methanothrix sp.]|nr:hypothetical protein [Methanothrix sp.]